VLAFSNVIIVPSYDSYCIGQRHGAVFVPVKGLISRPECLCFSVNGFSERKSKIDLSLLIGKLFMFKGLWNFFYYQKSFESILFYFLEYPFANIKTLIKYVYWVGVTDKVGILYFFIKDFSKSAVKYKSIYQWLGGYYIYTNIEHAYRIYFVNANNKVFLM
jgi:hypothetical protein